MNRQSPRPLRLLLYSKLAFYPIHWQAFLYICSQYCVDGVVIANTPPPIPAVHQQLGTVSPVMQAENLGIQLYYMPETDWREKTRWLLQHLDAIQPDAIWVQEEPTDSFLLQVLKHYLFNRKPIIVSSVCENIFSPVDLRGRISRRLLWSRLDGLMGVATNSIHGIQAVGMPRRVKASPLIAGALLPPNHVEAMTLPFERTAETFVVGFVGRICEEKGWRILLQALELLPPNFKCLIAGDGPEAATLLTWITREALESQVFYEGLLPKEALWRFYAALDCLVVPSLTRPTWKEQFGGVIADGLAMGIPVVGSNSGAIPEVIGNGGLIVEEANPRVVANALMQLYNDPRLRAELGQNGRQRFDQEFAIPTYARKIAHMLKLTQR